MARLWLVCLALVCLFNSDGLAADRFAAMFADGSRAEESDVREWCEPSAQAKIGGRSLFDSQNPVRWILDRSFPPPLKPSKYIEFSGGDRVAGEVVAFSDGRENPYESRPPHLLVKPAFDVLPPEVNSTGELRISTEWVQRIVWERSGAEEYRPGTVWTKAGAAIAFRSLRWKTSSVMLLTSDGLKELPFSDLGEVHFPRIDPWTAYFDQLAILSPDSISRLMQIECGDGTRCTTSVERFQPRNYGDRNRPEQWYQLIQPVWSIDPIWLRYRTIRSWRFFAPNEVPLSSFAIVQAQHQAVFGLGWDWQTDQNAQHGPLQSQDQDFGWGFGVFGTSELTFELPEIATEMRTSYGLDRSAKTGGCVSMEIVDGMGKTVAKQENVIGSAFVGFTGAIKLPQGQPAHRRLSFRTEMAHESRPAGADPFDIRDFFNWYEPEVRLDQSALQAEVRSRSDHSISGLIGWNLSTVDRQSLRVANVLDSFDSRDPQFRRVVRSTDRFYTLSRKVQFGARDRWMAIAASRYSENTSPTQIQVRIDGRVYCEVELPIRNSMTDPEPILVPIESFQGKTSTVELVVYPKDEKSWVDWRGFALGADRPGLRTVFEDDLKCVGVLNSVSGRIELDAEKPYSGSRSLKVGPGITHNARMPGLEAMICESPQLGQYRFIVFAWKKANGNRIQIQLANQGILGDAFEVPPADRLSTFHQQGLRRSQNLDERGERYRYCYERGVATATHPIPLWLSGELPVDWQLVQRDLFGDFGTFSLTGFSLNSVGGDAAWFDHCYLARTHEDLNFASTYLVNPQPPSPQPNENGHLWIARREDYAAEISRVAPLFSSIDVPHGLVRHTEQNGQTNVLKTHANDRDKPLVLRAGVELPKDRPKMLDLHVTHQPQCDWQLVVKANGEVLTSQLINEKLTIPQRGWATIQVDLSKYAGQKVLLEVLNESNDWQNETAFWKRVDLFDK